MNIETLCKKNQHARTTLYCSKSGPIHVCDYGIDSFTSQIHQTITNKYQVIIDITIN